MEVFDITAVRAKIRDFEATEAYQSYVRDQKTVKQRLRLHAVRNLKERLTSWESADIAEASKRIAEFESQRPFKDYSALVQLVDA